MQYQIYTLLIKLYDYLCYLHSYYNKEQNNKKYIHIKIIKKATKQEGRK